MHISLRISLTVAYGNAAVSQVTQSHRRPRRRSRRLVHGDRVAQLAGVRLQ